MKQHFEPVPEHDFAEIEQGRMRILLRPAQGNYSKGDQLIIRERHHMGAFTGREATFSVTEVVASCLPAALGSLARLLSGQVCVSFAKPNAKSEKVTPC